MADAYLNIDVDLSGIENRIDEWQGKANVFANHVEGSTRKYVPLDEGHLQNWVSIGSTGGKAQLGWHAPYAQRVYNLPQKNIRKIKNPNARSHWFEEAKKLHLDDWNDFAERLF